jgi:hypothetical protein
MNNELTYIYVPRGCLLWLILWLTLIVWVIVGHAKCLLTICSFFNWLIISIYQHFNLTYSLINLTIYYKYMPTLVHSPIIYFELVQIHISHKHYMDHWHRTHVYYCTNIQEFQANISSHRKSFKVYKTWFDPRFAWVNLHYVTRF